MARNAWKFGWVMSYPKGKTDVTCFTYEPWHYRYVGRDVAAAIHESGLTTREYLWEHYTQIDPVTGEPIPNATIPPSAPPSLPPPSGIPSQAPATAEASSVPGGSPTATSPPTSGAGTWFGLDPPVVVVGVLLVLALLALAITLGSRRSGPARGPRGR
jgi:D-alanyl-D-alanine carboxypeptidase